MAVKSTHVYYNINRHISQRREKLLMKKIINFITEKRNYILVFMLLVTCVSIFAMSKVNINQDMTKYLPSNSSMKKGIDILKKELPDVKNMSTIWVMVDDLDNNKKL